MSQIPSAASRRARRARDRYQRCPVCTRADVGGLHVDRCEERERHWQRAARAIEAADIPGVTGLDLWAHLNGRTHNELVSTLVVEVLIDLGWRPVVGSEPTRLWKQPDEADDDTPTNEENHDV